MMVILFYYIKKDDHFILLLYLKGWSLHFIMYCNRDVRGALNSLVVGGKKWATFK